MSLKNFTNRLKERVFPLDGVVLRAFMEFVDTVREEIAELKQEVPNKDLVGAAESLEEIRREFNELKSEFDAYKNRTAKAVGKKAKAKT